MSCGICRRCGSDPMLLWLWSRPAATALIRPLAWESPHAVGAALKKRQKTKKYIYIYNRISRINISFSLNTQSIIFFQFYISRILEPQPVIEHNKPMYRSPNRCNHYLSLLYQPTKGRVRNWKQSYIFFLSQIHTF